MASAIDFGPNVLEARRSGFLAFDSVRSASELRHCAERWHELDAHVATPMQTWAWIEAAAATFQGDGPIEILVGRDGDEVVAGAPLITRSRLSPRKELLSYHGLYEPADLAFCDAEANAALAEALWRRGRPLFLPRVFAASPTVAAMERAVGRSGKLIVRPQAATPWIALDESWASPEQKLSSRRRSDFRRSRRHAEQAGPVRAELLSPHSDEAEALLDRAFDVERRSWKGTTGTALADSRAGEFYRRYAKRTADAGQFRIAFLHVGNQVAATQFGVVHGNRYWVLKVGYDPQIHRSSPGILLMVEAIKQAVAEGLETYELLGTVEPWIQVWTELERPCVSLRWYPASFGGGLALTADMMEKAG
ncbi:MAG TPA: GNAT family N-acetyltransferase, partial [Pirellulales bacterium]|nr:GNAT family N-acetyltransferase [Pirellulales bacterium]